MKHSIKTGIILLISLYYIGGLQAQQNLRTKDTITIDEVVVTGSQVKTNRSNVPLSVSVINSTQIEESDESAILPILNGRVPGLFVTERGITGFGVARGSAGQISIRGIGGSPTTGVLMLIDGHPQFMGIMGHPLPDSYVASDVERVEVIRGSSSVLYGSNAMGGVINIITKKQTQQGTHGNVRISYGSHNTQKYMGTLGFKKNKFSAFASVNHNQTDGHRANSAFKINNGYLKLAYSVNSHFSTSTDVSLAAFTSSDPGPNIPKGKPGEDIDILRGYWSFSLLNEFDKLSGAIKLFHNFGEHNITDGFHSTDHSYGINFYESFKLFKGNTLTTGFDIINYGGLAENERAKKGEGIVFADTSITEYGFYALTRQNLGQRFALHAGIRYHHHSTYGRQLIPSLGFSYKVNESMTWKGNASKGFRSPTMRELFLWGPNPKLKPEQVWNYETSIYKSFLNNKLNTELTLYMVEGNNLIVNAGPPKGYLNSGKVSNKGIEIVLNATPTKNFSLNATYSYIKMNKVVYATPQQHLFLNANYRIKKVKLMTSIQHIGNLDNDPSPKENQVSYTLLNAKITYNINPKLKVFVSGNNLLNVKYEVNRYYTMPRATLFAGINFRF